MTPRDLIEGRIRDLLRLSAAAMRRGDRRAGATLDSIAWCEAADWDEATLPPPDISEHLARWSRKPTGGIDNPR